MEPNGLVVLVDEDRLSTTGRSLGFTFSAISSQRLNGDIETAIEAEADIVEVKDIIDDGPDSKGDPDPPGCNGKSNMHR